jgi:hypothetical protein
MIPITSFFPGGDKVKTLFPPYQKTFQKNFTIENPEYDAHQGIENQKVRHRPRPLIEFTEKPR